MAMLFLKHNDDGHRGSIFLADYFWIFLWFSAFWGLILKDFNPLLLPLLLPFLHLYTTDQISIDESFCFLLFYLVFGHFWLFSTSSTWCVLYFFSFQLAINPVDICDCRHQQKLRVTLIKPDLLLLYSGNAVK